MKAELVYFYYRSPDGRKWGPIDIGVESVDLELFIYEDRIQLTEMHGSIMLG